MRINVSHERLESWVPQHLKKLKELILKKLQDVLLIRKIISIEYIQKYAKDTLLLLTRVFWTVTKS